LLSVPPFLLQLAMKRPIYAASKKRFYLPGRLYRSVVFMRTWRLCRCLCEPARTTDRAGRAPTRPICDTRPSGGWASFSFFCSGRAGGRRLKIHAGPGGWAVDFSTGRPWASPGFLKILPRAKLRNPILILMDSKVIQG